MDGNQVFDTISAISMALIFLLILINISRIKFTKIDSIITFVLFTTTIRGMDFIPVNTDVSSTLTHGVLIIIAFFITNRRLQIISLSMFYAVLMSAISLLAAQIASIVMIFSFAHLSGLGAITKDFVSSTWGLASLYVIIVFFLSFFTSNLCGRFLHKRLGTLDHLLKGKFSIYLLVGASLTLALFFITVLLYDTLDAFALREMVYGLSLGLCFAYFVFSLFTFNSNMQIEIESKHLKDYSEHIEVLNKELRAFRHDQFNLLLGFSEYIKNGDLAGIESYYNSYIKTLHTNADVAAFDLNLGQLMNIKIPSIKAILSYKLQYAHLCGIDVKIKAIGEVNSINKNIGLIDLCRIIGIFLDNAIEACVELDKNQGKAVLEFAAIDNDKYVSFQFANTFHTLPSLSKMFEEGFTTKSDGRGLGLYIVSKIVAENDGLTLESHIHDYGLDKYLIHELNIAKGDQSDLS